MKIAHLEDSPDCVQIHATFDRSHQQCNTETKSDPQVTTQLPAAGGNIWAVVTIVVFAVVVWYAFTVSRKT